MDNKTHKNFICPKCGKSFKATHHLNTHLNKKIPCTDKIIQCIVCGKTFKTNQQLFKHLDKKTPCTPVTYINDDNISLQDKYNFIIKQYEQSKNYIKELQTCNSQLFNEIDDKNNQIITLSFNLAKATFNIKDWITYHYNHSNIHDTVTDLFDNLPINLLKSVFSHVKLFNDIDFIAKFHIETSRYINSSDNSRKANLLSNLNKSIQVNL